MVEGRAGTLRRQHRDSRDEGWKEGDGKETRKREDEEAGTGGAGAEMKRDVEIGGGSNDTSRRASSVVEAEQS